MNELKKWPFSMKELETALRAGGNQEIFSCQFCGVKQTGTGAYDFPDKYRVMDDKLYCARCEREDMRFFVTRRPC